MSLEDMRAQGGQVTKTGFRVAGRRGRKPGIVSYNCQKQMPQVSEKTKKIQASVVVVYLILVARQNARMRRKSEADYLCLTSEIARCLEMIPEG